MAISRRHFLAGSGAAALTASVRAQAPTYTLETIAAGKTLKDAGGRVVLSYLTSKPEGVPLAGNSVCCIHPFNTPGGECATDIAPPDHRDHRGIFFAWHDMTFARRNDTGAQGAERGGGPPRSDRASRGAGVPDDLKGDFWGWGQFAPTDGRVIRNRDVKLARADANAAEIEVVNDWMIGADRVMQATETIRPVSLGSSGPMARVLDLRYVFTSDYEVTINKMAFTGFCFRARKEGPYTFFDADGEVTVERQPNSNATRPETDWPARKWYSHRVTLQNGKVVSSAVVDHPGNPPSLWHGARGVSFLNPCISAQSPVIIPAGKPLTLRYLAIAADGELPAAWVEGVADGWRGR